SGCFVAVLPSRRHATVQANCPPTGSEGGCLLCGRPACWANWMVPVRLGGCCWIGDRLRRICDLVAGFRLTSRSKLPSHSGRRRLSALLEASLLGELG